MAKKIISIALISMIIITIFSYNITFARVDSGGGISSSTQTTNPDNVITGANDFVSNGEQQVQQGQALKSQELKNASDFLYNILLAIAMVTAMAIGIAIGIKFMVASASEKAEVKELLWPYVLGCIVVFGAMGIWKLAVTIFSEF